MKTLDLQLLPQSLAFQRGLQLNSIDKIDFQLLGQGEYNINYLFTRPHTQKKLVLRLTTASQMHLDNQIRYEYETLKLLVMVFLRHYCQRSTRRYRPEELWKTTLPYFSMTCLRGITWCSMAWVEYQAPDKLIRNEDTYQKIREYLSEEFLQHILKDYLEAKR